MAQYKQLNIFGELEDIQPARKKSKKDDYDSFVDKFKTKKTTDDCYTPPNVYEAVLKWVRETCNLGDRPIVRPFYPGGDFVRFDYPQNCVVVDNPPFSILAKIIKWYNENKIDYFLWSPDLSGIRAGATLLVTNRNILYHNGADIHTGFCSNLFGDKIVMTAPSLRKVIAEADKINRGKDKKQIRRYTFPPSVLRVNDLNKIVDRGLEFTVSQSEGVVVGNVCNYNTFGNSVLLNDVKTAEKMRLLAVPVVPAVPAEQLTLTLQEKQIIKELNNGK